MQAPSSSGLLVSSYPPSAHSELWSNQKHLNLHLEYCDCSGLTDVNNTKYDPDLGTL